jgi:hypothetical protein
MQGFDHAEHPSPYARDISYATPPNAGGRAMIRVMENATGRIGLIKRGDGL